jgi:hypothetical protein
VIASLRVLCGARGLGFVPWSARPASFCSRPLVWAYLLPRSILPGSLYALLTRFRALTPPRVRFTPVWPSTDRTVSERWVWWVVVAC